MDFVKKRASAAARAASPVASRMSAAAVDVAEKTAAVAGDAAAASSDAAKGQMKKFINDTCGEGSSEAISAVTEIVKKVYADLFPDESRYPLWLDLSMIVRQVLSEERYPKPLLSGVAYDEPLVFKKAARYALFANAVYRKTKEEVAERIPELSVDCIRHWEQSKAVKCPNFLIAEDPVTGALVLAIRGTATAADALTDCLCDEVPFLRGKAHGAIAENARNVISIAKPILKDILKDSPEKKVVITGHSLGAGTSVLTALELFSEDSPDPFHDVSLVECFAFAPPPVFYPREALPSGPAVYSLINNMDCIPRTCLGTGIKLMLAVKEVDNLGMGLTERVKALTSPSKDEKLPDFKEIPEELQSKFASHSPVGSLIIFYPDDSAEIRIEKLEPEHTDRLLIHPQMASDHSMGKYCKILQEVVLKQAAAGMGVTRIRVPIQLERLPADKLKDVASALKVLEDFGLSEVGEIQGLRRAIEKKIDEKSEKDGEEKKVDKNSEATSLEKD